MRVLLIWPTGMSGENYSIFPLALGYLKNSIKDNPSIECDIVDCALNNITPKKLIKKIFGYDLIGISAWGFNIKNVQDTIDLIKKNSDAIIVTGGSSAQLAKADYMILGEGEIAFKSFVNKLLEGDIENLTQIPGVVEQGDIPRFPTRFHDNLDEFGLIDYEELQLDRYISSGYKYWMYSLKDKFKTASIIATRGCPYHCAHCMAPLVMGRKIRKHSIEYIIKTIEYLVQKHSIEQISFLDDNITFDMDYAKKLCEEIIRLKERKGYNFILTTSNGVRVDRIDEELIKLMKKAGWAEIVIAPESGSPDTLKRMRRNIDLADVYKKVELIHKHRMNAVGFFMYGYPGETKEDLNLTKEYILNSKFDRCIIHYFCPFPGTPIYEELLNKGKSVMISVNYASIGYIPDALTKEDLHEFEKSVEEKTVFKEKWIKDL
jgi:radical SAM superfamily enzyme YgiQ (UPF0313 family)